jgi:hypothetical protein
MISCARGCYRRADDLVMTVAGDLVVVASVLLY